MKRTSLHLAVIAALALLPLFAGRAQVHVFAGLKSWYASWDVQIQADPGTIQSDYSPAFMAGPYVSLRLENFTLTGSYSATMKHFDAETRNAGLYAIGFNANRVLTREDINVFLNYNILPEISLFLNAKFLKYRAKDAFTDIGRNNFTDEQNVSSTGYGFGAQITTPFGGSIPFYSYISISTVWNNYTNKERNYSGTERVSIVDGGLGYRILSANIGATLGLRVEDAKEDKTIIGPTASVFAWF